MATKSWLITDVSQRIHVADLAEDLAEVGAALKGCSVTKRTLHGGLSEGVDEITVETGAGKVVLLPTRGMSIWKAWAGDLELGWKSPNHGPVHPQYVDLGEPSGLGWLDGFDELLPRCGLESNGAPEHDPKTNRLLYPLHGRIANRPAAKVEVTADGETGEIRVTGVVRETRFHFLKLQMVSTLTMKAGQSGFRIRDEIENLSANPAEIQMLYHFNFGEPLLDAGSRFVAPLKTVVPRNERAAAGINGWENYGAGEVGYEEQVYFMEVVGDAEGNSRSLLKNAHGNAGVSLHFNKKQLPCYTVWKNTTDSRDGYVTGLEPGTNFPNPRTYEGKHNRVVKLKGGGKFAFDVGLTPHTDAAGVAEAEKAIAALQSGTPRRVYDAPQRGWCAPPE